MGSNSGSIGEITCFKMKTKTEPGADVWGAKRIENLPKGKYQMQEEVNKYGRKRAAIRGSD